MDETNERFVFDLIAQVSKKNSSQYFLMSPKLLTKLNYTRELKIHIIFNAQHVFVDWNKILAKILKFNPTESTMDNGSDGSESNENEIEIDNAIENDTDNDN